VQLHAAVRRVPWGPGRVNLWQGDTGRGVVLAEDLLSDLPPGLQVRLWREGMLADEPPDCGRLIPCRSPRVLLLPGRPALWVPRPLERGAGGFPYRALELEPVELALWCAFNDSRSLAAVASTVGVDLEQALVFVRRLAALEVQALQLRPRPPRPGEPGLGRLQAPPRPRGHHADSLRGAHGQTELTAWHGAIDDPQSHFDLGETTVAHAFGEPHSALGGEPFGACLHGALRARFGPCRGTLLEIGPGSGELGAAWRAAAGGELPRAHLRLDASPALLGQQAQRQPGTHGLRADACAPPLRDGSLDLVICNEVIADLSAVPWDGSPAEPGTPQAAVSERVARYGLQWPAEARLFNLGAWRLLEALARVLAPGGGAYVSEFGALDELPTETSQLDHPEVSIHFDELAAVAQGLGLEAEVVPMAELLGFDTGARWLARGSFEALRCLDPKLASRAWTPETLPLPEPVEGLRWVPITQDGPGPVVTRFLCLLVRRVMPHHLRHPPGSCPPE
jgi:SAM-dependent methyltransferase